MKVVIDNAFSQYAGYIGQLPSLIEAGEGDVIYDKRNRVVRVCRDGQVFIVKRYKRVNVVQQIAYTFFRKSKAERAYLFAGEFARRGIDTPQRVAYMERTRAGLFSVGYFVSLESAGTETHLLLREVQDFSHKMADAVAAQVVRMHSKGVLHGDLNLSNFLCREEADGYRFMMIDINRSKFCDGFSTDDDCLRNLVRLTHRRDLYEYLIASYARQRGWDVQATVEKALRLLDKFENQRFRL